MSWNFLEAKMLDDKCIENCVLVPSGWIDRKISVLPSFVTIIANLAEGFRTLPKTVWHEWESMFTRTVRSYSFISQPGCEGRIFIYNTYAVNEEQLISGCPIDGTISVRVDGGFESYRWFVYLTSWATRTAIYIVSSVGTSLVLT